jgi:ArsR family transcriptional regulator
MRFVVRARFTAPARASRRGRRPETIVPPPSQQLQTLKAEFFRALAHPIRIRLLEVLVATPARSVQDLQRTLDIDQPIVSQQLARLRASGIVIATRRGAATRYSVIDPLLEELLAVAKRILNRRLVDTQHLLRELARDELARSRRRRI